MQINYSSKFNVFALYLLTSDAALQGMRVAEQQEVAGARRQQVVRENVELARVVDLQAAHDPEERLARGIVDAVVGLRKLAQVAARAVDHRIQDLHDGEPTAAERFDHLLRRVGEHAKHETAHTVERDVTTGRGPDRAARRIGIEDHRVRVGQEERLLVGDVQRGTARRDEPVAAGDRIVHIGLRVRLGHEEAALGTPIPIEVRVEAAALLRRNEEVGGAHRALYLARPEAGVCVERVLRGVLRAYVAPEGHVMRHKEAEAQAAIDHVLREIVGGVLPEDHARVATRGQDRRLVAHREVQHEAATDGGDVDVLCRRQVRCGDVVTRHLNTDAIAEVVADARPAAEAVRDLE